MKTVIQIEIPDEDLTNEGLSAETILEETLDIISLHYQMSHRFFFDIGYNPELIAKGGKS